MLYVYLLSVLLKSTGLTFLPCTSFLLPLCERECPAPELTNSPTQSTSDSPTAGPSIADFVIMEAGDILFNENVFLALMSVLTAVTVITAAFFVKEFKQLKSIREKLWELKAEQEDAGDVPSHSEQDWHPNERAESQGISL